MILFYLAFTCISRQREISIGRRSNKITFNSHSKLISRSNEDSWYFVYFNFDESASTKDKIISNLQMQGIFLRSTNYIYKNLFSLYLTPSQVNYIISKKYGKVQEVEKNNKLVNTHIKKWSLLTIESAHSSELMKDINQLNPKCQFRYLRHNPSVFTLKSTKSCLTSILPLLTEDKRIYSISYDNPSEPLNSQGVGFTQLNTYNGNVTLDDKDGHHIVFIDRFLNNQNLNGSGITILVDDTFLDVNSTYFYDPNYQDVPHNQPISGHRKLVYYDFDEENQDKNNLHGTHTAGSAAGSALDPLSSDAQYNGCAPGAKLAFSANSNSNFAAERITSVVDKAKPRVSTNSWGLTSDFGDPAETDAVWDGVQHRYKEQTLFIFSAGNDAITDATLPDGYVTLRHPGSAKNILTVGSIDQIAIEEETVGADSHEFYITGDDPVISHLTKLFEWSIGDPQKNVGYSTILASGRLQLSVSWYPWQFANTKTCVFVVESEEQFEELLAKYKDDPPYYVVSTVELKQKDTSFPVFLLQKDKIPQYSLHLSANYRTSKGYKRAEFSSKGLGNLGVMKPDIMCPGVSVMSALNVPDGGYNHGGQTIFSGTSMATPICAGAAAIVFQYFAEGHYRKEKIEISPSLARAFLVTCSDPLTTAHPNADEGYGVVNLGKYIGNGYEADNGRLLVCDRQPITVDGSSHIMSTFSVSSEKAELRITMSYIDLALSADSLVALAVDLDLVVVSPSQKVYRGNLRVDNTEEKFSTNERVIINASDVEEGVYKVHVFSSIPKSLPDASEKVDFAVVVSGPLAGNPEKFLSFKKADECIPADGSECDEETKRNVCSNLRYGHSCQIEAVPHGADSARKIIDVAPYGLSYVVLYRSSEQFYSIRYELTPVTVFEPKVDVFYSAGKNSAVAEADADEIHVRNGYSSLYVKDESTEEVYALLVVYNTAPSNASFVITAEVTMEAPTQQPKPPQPPTDEHQPTEEIPPSKTSEPIHSSSVEPPHSSSAQPIHSESAQPSNEPGKVEDQSKWKKKFVIMSAVAIVLGVVVIALCITMIVVLMGRRKKQDEKSLTQSLVNPLL